jgi:DNA polymerase III gamma/tau subunit
MSNTLPLILKYRPEKFEEVFGHQDIMKAVIRALKTPTHPHGYILTGPSGVGKTTIARLIGHFFQAEILEIDAASNSGVDAMRELVDVSSHNPLGGSGKRLILIDECHALSRPAFQTLLKMLEEPPVHLYFALCTTEDAKVPETIKTRCFPITLRSISPKDIESLLMDVCKIEKWQVVPDVITAVIEYADGSPRKALSGLQAVQGAISRDEVRRILTLIEATDAPIQLCQAVFHSKGPSSWPKIKTLINAIEPDEYETASGMMARYMATVMAKAENEVDAIKAWEILECLVSPTHTWDKKAALMAAIGRVLWSRSSST